MNHVIELGSSPALEDVSDIGQNLAALADGGFAVVWISAVLGFDGSAEVGTGLVQFVSPTGRTRLQEPAVVVESNTGGVWSPAVIPDRQGGVFTAFVSTGEFTPGPGFAVNLTVQRINSTGQSLWPGIGVVIADENPNLPVLVEDGREGAFVCFSDTRTGGSSDIFCQLVDSAGQVAWGGEPIAVAMEGGSRDLHRAIADDNGGVIVVWVENRDGITEIRAQRFDANGIRLWGDTGAPLAGTALSPGRFGLRMLGIASDGAGGVVASYEDVGQGSGRERRVLVQRIDDQGLPSSSGNVELVTDGEASRFHEATVADGSGNTYVVSRIVDSASMSSCRVDRVTPEGLLPWGLAGVELPVEICVRARAAFARGRLAVIVTSSSGCRVFTVLSNGSFAGPPLGWPAEIQDGMLPADVLWSARSGHAMSVWEGPATQNDWNIDVAGAIHRLAPPQPRHTQRRVGTTTRP